MKLTTLGASALLMASTAVAHADNWTAYTYSSVSTTSAVKGMNRIADRAAEETDGDLDITLHLGKTLQIASADITGTVLLWSVTISLVSSSSCRRLLLLCLRDLFFSLPLSC